MHTRSTYRRMFTMMGWSQKVTLLGLLLVLSTASSVGRFSKSFFERNRGSCFASALVGILGAFLGPWFAHQFTPVHLILTANQGNIASAVLGSVLVPVVLNGMLRALQFLLERFRTSAVADPARVNVSTSKH